MIAIIGANGKIKKLYTELGVIDLSNIAGSVAWGDITGTLSSQTDLQAELDAKVPISRTITINGDTQNLATNPSFTVSGGSGLTQSQVLSRQL